MAKHHNQLLLQPERLHWSAQAVGAKQRLEARAREAGQQSRTSDLEKFARWPVAHTVINARQLQRAKTDIPVRSEEATVKAVAALLKDTANQDYPNRGQTIIMVNRSFTSKEDYAEVAKRTDVSVAFFHPEIPHPVAYNQTIESLVDKEGREGMVFLGDVACRPMTNQVFRAGALALNEGYDAMQGTALASRNAGAAEAAFYATATLHPRFIGHRPRPAKAGPGYFAVNRSVVSLDAFSQAAGRFDGEFKPFNPAFGNGGYDGELGAHLPNGVLMDWAATVTASEGVSNRQMVQLLTAEWPSYSQPNPYQIPSIPRS